MRLHAIARADNRGLGIQTFEFVRHMRPDRVLVVDMGGATPYEQRFDRYPDARVARLGAFTDDDVDWLLDGADALYTAETAYDDRILAEARRRGVATAVQANHEFFRWIPDRQLVRPDLFLSPSTWYLEKWPAPKLLLPFPVARDRLPFRRRERVDTFLHVAGHRAAADRNGTRLLLDALRYVREPIRVLIHSQSTIPHNLLRPRGTRTYAEVEQADVADYWTLYDGCDALILPRRYGGLSLPINEALSAGMPVVSLDVEPQRRFLPAEGLVPPTRASRLRLISGQVDWWRCDPRHLARKIEQVATDPELVARLSDTSDAIATRLSWEAMEPRYRRVFETLAEHGPEEAARLVEWCPDGDALCAHA